MTDLLPRDVPDSPTVGVCPNCTKTNWAHTHMGEGHDRIECHECGLTLWGFAGITTDESAVRAWNLLRTTRSDLALAAQGALLEKAADVCNCDIPSATIRALSPDATAALAERDAKVRNDALREALEKITSNYPKNADTDYDKGLDYGLTSAAVIIEALITTEEKNDD